MDPISFAAGILPLFSVCLEYFQLFKTAQSSLSDSQTLLLGLDLESERFIIWSEHHGLFAGSEPEHLKQYFPRAKTRSKVLDVFRQITTLFESAESLRRYGVQATSPATGANGLEPQAEKFPSTSALDRLKWRKERSEIQDSTRQKLSLLAKTRWAFHDKAKFEALVSTVRGLIDGLYSLLQVSDAVRDRAVRHDIMTLLPDLARLQLVATASEKSYPAWSGAVTAIIELSEAGSAIGDGNGVTDWLARQRDIGSVSMPAPGASIVAGFPEKAPEPTRRTRFSLAPIGRQFFVFTSQCATRTRGLSCDKATLEILRQAPSFITEHDKDSTGGLGNRITRSINPKLGGKGLDAFSNPSLSYEASAAIVKTLFPLEKVRVYCSACRCAIRTALQLCSSQSSQEVEWLARIDDRIHVSCCAQAHKLNRLSEIRQTLDQLDANIHPHSTEFSKDLLKKLDRVALEKCIYRLENEGNTESEFQNWNELLKSQNTYDAISVYIVEVTTCGWVVRTAPFPSSSRMPREYEIFQFSGSAVSSRKSCETCRNSVEIARFFMMGESKRLPYRLRHSAWPAWPSRDALEEEYLGTFLGPDHFPSGGVLGRRPREPSQRTSPESEISAPAKGTQIDDAPTASSLVGFDDGVDDEGDRLDPLRAAKRLKPSE